MFVILLKMTSQQWWNGWHRHLIKLWKTVLSKILSKKHTWLCEEKKYRWDVIKVFTCPVIMSSQYTLTDLTEWQPSLTLHSTLWLLVNKPLLFISFFALNSPTSLGDDGSPDQRPDHPADHHTGPHQQHDHQLRTWHRRDRQQRNTRR